MKTKLFKQTEKGSVLIGIIATMVIMSVLGAAMYSMTSTSVISGASGHISKAAYYLAESGFRYAAAEYLTVTDSGNNGLNNDQNQMADNLNGRILSLSPGGTIELAVIPFHCVTSGTHANGVTALNVRFAGATPAGFSVPGSGHLQIRSQSRPDASADYTTYVDTYEYSNFSGNTFTLESPLVVRAPLTVLPAWTSITVIARPAAAGNITPGTNATLALHNPSAGAGSFFMPERNGKFMIEGNPVVYVYDYRVDGTTTTTLHGIYNSKYPDNNDQFSVETDSRIIPTDFFRIVSTGVAGNVRRTLTYITPVDVVNPGSDGTKTTATDTFDGSSGTQPTNWQPVFGTHSIRSQSGGTVTGDTTAQSALRLDSSYEYRSSTGIVLAQDLFLSLIALKPGRLANFWASWNAHNKTLSYDAQVKVKVPQQQYFMVGANFRMNLSSQSIDGLSSLGVSLQRGRTGSNCTLFFCTDRDGIDNSLVPVDNMPLIVLWRKVENQSPGLEWIAYKAITDTILFNSGHPPRFVNGENSYFIRGGNSGARANVKAVGTTDGGTTGSLVLSRRYSTFQANEPLHQLVLQGSVTARVQTASDTSITYDRGTDSTTLIIVAGDIICGRNSDARARVTSVGARTRYRDSVFSPYYYRGELSIEQTEGTFSTNEFLDVYRPNADFSARFVSLEALTDILNPGTETVKDWTTIVLRIEEKIDTPDGNVNDIRVYVGDTNQHGTPDGSPLDAERFGNLRWRSPVQAGDVRWPPEEGWSDDQAANIPYDYFTLIQNWVINPNFSSSVWLAGTAEEPNAIVRTTQYTTHNLANHTQSEIGLHTFGSGMNLNTYFDDFGIQLVGATTGGTRGFTSPLQY
ncbi:MAG: pilus assembly PilX N-terminal domain-containing protein [Syntrophales bacterium]|jgi:hypothetical protein|nr:pilus assembly PilX N-terminal domain-containing protein [Syntrophales bacterium]MCK9528801.1 pilus assembly PilX N-terminal domain-containing protein [Syntrophales bacterium]MDX9922748.1 pilus assembly PilX N-terminal domain-containing protein [Syntrophales bacterium]